MERSYDLIVVGGGFAGSWVAYHSVQEKLNTLLITRDPPQGTSSWMSGGILSPHAEMLAGTWRELGLKGIVAYKELLADSPLPRTFGFGVFLPFEEEDPAEPFLNYLQNTQGVRWESLDKPEIQRITGEPRFLGGIFLPEDAYVDPRQALLRLHEGYLSHGGALLYAQLLKFSPIPKSSGIEVRTRERVLYCHCLLLATGIFTDLEGKELPQTIPDRGIMVRIHHPQPPVGVIFHHGKTATTYIVPDPVGVRLGSTTQPHDLRREPDPVELGELLLRGGKLWKPLREGRLGEVGVGFRPLNPRSSEPFCVEIDGCKNILFFSGLHRHGVLLSPQLAAKIVKKILSNREGETP